eukprot:scaffold69650_cov34-Prasinocladus_malaysianus.AAC.1
MDMLQALQRYEACRATSNAAGLDWRLKEAMYRADAQMLLQDEPCFRMVRTTAGQSTKVGLSLVNSQLVQTTGGPSSAPPLDFQVLSAAPSPQKYIKGWIDREYGPDERPAGFLAR